MYLCSCLTFLLIKVDCDVLLLSSRSNWTCVFNSDKQERQESALSGENFTHSVLVSHLML